VGIFLLLQNLDKHCVYGVFCSSKIGRVGEKWASLKQTKKMMLFWPLKKGKYFKLWSLQ
jgi:hypothetical protein